MAESMDLYDARRNPTGEILLRGEAIPGRRFRLGVQVWLKTTPACFLLTQRHPAKKKGFFESRPEAR